MKRLLYLLLTLVVLLVGAEAYMVLRFKGIPYDDFRQRVGDIEADGFTFIQQQDVHVAYPAAPAFIRWSPLRLSAPLDSYEASSGAWAEQFGLTTGAETNPVRVNFFARRVGRRVVGVTISSYPNEDVLAEKLQDSLVHQFPEIHVRIVQDEVKFAAFGK